MAKITFYIPDQDPVKFGLGEKEIVSIGRAPDCDIVLDHGSVSGHHAEIRKIGAGLHMLVDQNSTNGIFLEGDQVMEAPLSAGASISIGSVPADFESDNNGAHPPGGPNESVESDAAPATVSADSGDANLGGDLGEGGGYGVPSGAIAETSVRPAGFRDMSPVEKVEKKDNLSRIAIIIGLIALAAAGILALLAVMMKVN